MDGLKDIRDLLGEDADLSMLERDIDESGERSPAFGGGAAGVASQIVSTLNSLASELRRLDSLYTKLDAMDRAEDPLAVAMSQPIAKSRKDPFSGGPKSWAKDVSDFELDVRKIVKKAVDQTEDVTEAAPTDATPYLMAATGTLAVLSQKISATATNIGTFASLSGAEKKDEDALFDMKDKLLKMYSDLNKYVGGPLTKLVKKNGWLK